ncbi:tRNA pseudouridine(55) synthase TruB [Marisediminicola sp. LYQ134]|uniref:tRNA pseudouridine(55) synthase TruB n=1 Tax=Marisediminicola sp. LYQ134 TaxID=3391061 RepID=UPI003983823A
MQKQNPESVTRSSGILLVDKAEGLTSHDVVARTRKLAQTRKVGHAGTLDPMATGLLVLGLNSSTRLLTFLVGLDKEYFATIRLGASTSTDDREGDVVSTTPAHEVDAVTAERIAEEVGALRGPIEQRPSSVSAIKVDGKRAYARVRDGEEVELATRPVTVSAFEVLDERRESGVIELDVRIECSSGTYVRALARDLGEALGTGGHLTALRRSRVGPFGVAEARTLEDVVVADSILAPADVATALFDSIALDAQQVVDLTHGKRIAVETADGQPYAALAPDGRLVGLLEVANGRAKPIVNFPTDEVTS